MYENCNYFYCTLFSRRGDKMYFIIKRSLHKSSVLNDMLFKRAQLRKAQSEKHNQKYIYISLSTLNSESRHPNIKHQTHSTHTHDNNTRK